MAGQKRRLNQLLELAQAYPGLERGLLLLAEKRQFIPKANDKASAILEFKAQRRAVLHYMEHDIGLSKCHIRQLIEPLRSPEGPFLDQFILERADGGGVNPAELIKEYAPENRMDLPPFSNMGKKFQGDQHRRRERDIAKGKQPFSHTGNIVVELISGTGCQRG